MLFPPTDPIVSLIRHPHNRMRMELPRLRIRQKHTAVMIKFQNDDGTLHAVIKRVVVTVAADPGEVGLVEMFLDEFEFCGARGGGEVEEELFADLEE